MKRKINQCNGKTPYDTESEANHAVTGINKQGGKPLRSYRCSICSHFHLGHESKGKLLNPKSKLKPIRYVHEPKVHKGNRRFLR